MKVICIDKDNCKHITIGKVYECDAVWNTTHTSTVLIEDDSLTSHIYDYRLFVTLEEYRNMKLTDIGI